jgi:uncharacterized membrane protein
MERWTMNRRLARHEERGAILILSVLFIVVMVVACALAIDLGFQSVDRRTDHKVADLVALDASRALDDINGPGCSDALQQSYIEGVAANSANNNGFNPTASGHRMTVEIGNADANKVFTPAAAGQKCWPNSKAVRVTVGSVTQYKFLPGSQSQSAKAVAVYGGGPATDQNTQGGFTLGSFLANVDSTQAAILNTILCQAMKGISIPGPASLPVSCPQYNLSAAAWSGLGAANFSMNELGHALAANGVIGSPDQVFGATVGADQLFRATGDALTNRQPPDTADATVMYNLGNGVSGSRPVSIPKLVDQQGAQGSALADQKDINVGGLVLGAATAQIANSQNAVAVLNAGITVPGISNVGLNLAVIQAQQSTCCGVKPYPTPPLSTSQLKTGNGMTVTFSNLPVTIPGVVSPAALSGNVSVSLTGAGADAQMTDASCVTSPGMTVTVTPKPYDLAVSNSAALSLTVGGLPVSSIGVSAAQTVTGAAQAKAFAYQPATQTFTPNPQRVGSGDLNLSAPTYNVTVNGTPAGVLPSVVATAVATAVQNAMGQLNPALQNLYRELGLNVGGADVTADTLVCNGQIGTSGNNTPVLVS